MVKLSFEDHKNDTPLLLQNMIRQEGYEPSGLVANTTINIYDPNDVSAPKVLGREIFGFLKTLIQ